MTIDAGPQKNALSDPYDIGWIPFDDSGYTEDEAYAFLTADVSAVFAQQAVLTASANPAAHTGAMIALVPSREDLARLALDGGEPMEELHLTLAYLGEAAAIDEDTRSRIIDAGGGYFTESVNTEAFSVNVFNPHNPDTETAIVLGIRGEEMVDNHSNLMSAVRGVYGGMPDNHRPWIPHVTLKYTDDVTKERQEDFLARLGSVKFDTLRFAFADENVDIPLYDEDEENPLTAGFKFWREKDHPRDDDGKFTDGGADISKRLKKAASGNAALKSVTDDSKADISAVRNYQSSGGDESINGALRQSSEDTLGDIDAMSLRGLDEAFKTAKTSEDIVVYRGIAHPSKMFGGAWNLDFDADNSGLTWKDRGFTSTSVDKGISERFAMDTMMRILVPKGTNAMHLSESPGLVRDEKEILLNRGLTFRIVKDHGKDPVTFVRQLDVEVLEENHEPLS